MNFTCCVSGRCQWGPQCPAPVVPIGDAAADTGGDTGGPDATDASAGPEADACAPSSCECPSSNTHNVSTVVDGCIVWQCCVDFGADAADTGASDAEDASGE